jgi:branched-chain amino acid transport system ATP-binding protein
VSAAGAAGSAAPVLELRDVHAYIDVSTILQGVSLTVPANAVTVILGRNGVGKTTTLRSVLGLVRRTGRISLLGEPIETLETSRIVRRGVAYVPEDRDVFRRLTVTENLRLAELKGREPRYDLVYELFGELRERGRQPAGSLSGGQQQMLSLARALLNETAVMLVDEPTKGLAPRVVGEVVTVLERAREVSTIVMVEQNLAVARRLADHVVVMSEGRVVAEGDRTMLEDDRRMRRLLGIEAAEAEKRKA